MIEIHKNNMGEFLKNLHKGFTDLFFPQFCLRCDSFGELLCDKCIDEYPLKNEQKCAICDKNATKGFTHPSCVKKYGVDRLIVICSYKDEAKELIHKVKYNNTRFAMKYLISLMKRKHPNLDEFKNFVICPIPLHKKKLQKRGYNQSVLIAEAIDKEYITNGIGLLLDRIKETKPQNKLNKESRKNNLKNAFRATTLKSLPKKVLIVDDVTTSQSTFTEAAKCLKKEGVEEVWCLAIARGEQFIKS